MRKEIRKRIRRNEPGLNIAADVHSVVVVNDGRSRAGEADRDDRASDDRREEPREGGADQGSGA
jgi:hypothetical protein